MKERANMANGAMWFCFLSLDFLVCTWILISFKNTEEPGPLKISLLRNVIQAPLLHVAWMRRKIKWSSKVILGKLVGAMFLLLLEYEWLHRSLFKCSLYFRENYLGYVKSAGKGMSVLVQNKRKWISWSNLSFTKKPAEQRNEGMRLQILMLILKENTTNDPCMFWEK